MIQTISFLNCKIGRTAWLSRVDESRSMHGVKVKALKPQLMFKNRKSYKVHFYKTQSKHLKPIC